MYEGTVRDIVDILQQGYGDNSTTPLDRAVANRIVTYLAEKGWMHPSEVAYMVKAAGGEIRVNLAVLTDDPPLLYRQHDFPMDQYVFRAVDKPDPSKAKVNPDAEQRTRC